MCCVPGCGQIALAVGAGALWLLLERRNARLRLDDGAEDVEEFANALRCLKLDRLVLLW